MEAASLSLEHGLDGVDSAPLPSPPPHPQLAVSPPQGKLELPIRSPVPARLGDDMAAVDEDKFLAMQQQLEAARKRIDELVAQQYQTRVETTEVPVTYPQPQIVEKVVEKFVEVPVEKFVEVPSPRCACLDSLRLQGTFCCNYVFRYATDVTLGGAGGKGGLP